MLTLQETLWQLARNKGRTLILLLASAMLAGCVAFYMSNITANEEAIGRLAATIPVEVRVTNPSGSQDWQININEHRHGNLLSSPYLTGFTYSIEVAGVYTEEAKAAVGSQDALSLECDTRAINSLDCIQVPDAKFTYMDGYDETMFQSDQPVGLIGTNFIERYGVQVGDEISLDLYVFEFIAAAGRDSNLTFLGDQTVRIVGTYESNMESKDLLIPVDWLAGVAREQGAKVNYNRMGAYLKDPRQISVFKESVQELGFLETAPSMYEDYTGAAIVVDDQQYVTSAETLGQTVVLFKRFQIPFFVLVIGMIILAIFLIMRGSRRVMAISISLGRPRFLCAAGCFLAAFIAELGGCALVFPAMILLAGLSVHGALTICGMFILCACAGNMAALMLLLRFNAFTLLTAVE